MHAGTCRRCSVPSSADRPVHRCRQKSLNRSNASQSGTMATGGCGLRALPSAGASAGISQYDQHLAALSPHAVNQAPYPIMPEGCSDPPPSTQVHFPSLQRYHVNFLSLQLYQEKSEINKKALNISKAFVWWATRGSNPGQHD